MKSLLSVQSHVAHGYVGGRAATFPLQYLGWDIDNINTVNFSNHTGYGHFEGSAIKPEELAALLKGLNDIKCSYDVVISGYIPSADLIDILAEEIAKLKLKNPDTMYICDTVMGDLGHMYVDDSCVQAYRRLLDTGIANVITPNQFELELLYGSAVTDEKTLREALSYMHEKFNIRHVVVSSLDAAVLNQDGLGLIYCVVSSKVSERSSFGTTSATPSASATTSLQAFVIPEIKSYFTGVGDLFTALLADKLYACPSDISRAVNQVLTIMSNVLKLTHQLGIEEYKRHVGDKNGSISTEGIMNDGSSMRFFELKIIQARQFYDYSDDGEFAPLSINRG